MTKEEYESLLQSDYWKGYSYSLIKERNFTCEDCGRSFPNMRNMLQVHHLTYRDAKPWSYDPSELIVLCKECHQRRHGIIPTPSPISEVDIDPNSRDEIPIPQQKDKSKYRFLLFACLITLVVYIALKLNEELRTQEPVKATTSESIRTPKQTTPRATTVNKSTCSEQSTTSQSDIVKIEPIELTTAIEEIDKQTEQASKKFSLDAAFPDKPISIEEITKKDVDKQAKSTIELIEERNHANAVERAKRLGVSTEGSTLDILERINHANAVERAERVGVSTEGSTSDILERIIQKNFENHLE